MHEDAIHDLIDHLAAARPTAPVNCDRWSICSLHGGANNLLYRATTASADLVVKFTIRDERDRAGREFAALGVLEAAGRALAPMPVLLERERYALPVVVQHYLAGLADATPPAREDEWQALVAHYLAVHSITAESTAIPLLRAVTNMTDATTGLHMIRDQLARIPIADQMPSLRAAVARIERVAFPQWSSPRLALCRVDANITNFVRRPGPWASVDWENSGWGDPVFELADLWTHPAYAKVPTAQRNAVVASYCALSPDRTAFERVHCYLPLMLVWWMARAARRLYDVPRGRDERLVALAPDWAAATQRLYEAYCAQANAALDQWL